MKKILFPLLLILFLLSGCASPTGELLSIPKAPYTHYKVQNALDTILASGGQHLAPLSGNNRNSVQLIDLDGDGRNELLSCFLVKEGDVSLPRVYIHKLEEGEYKLLGYVDGYGDSIDAIWYPELYFDDSRAIAIGWMLGTNPKRGVTVVRCADDTLETLYNGEYSALSVVDIDSDEIEDIVILCYTGTDEPGTAKLLRYESKELNVVSAAPLSKGIVSPGNVRSGFIEGGTIAVVADGMMYEQGYVTDCIIFSNGVLSNIFYSEDKGCSLSTLRARPIFTSDINSDNILELPKTEPMVSLPGMDMRWRIDWYSFDSSAAMTFRQAIYPSLDNGWVYRFPYNLIGKITVTNETPPEMQEYENCAVTAFRLINSDGTIGDTLWEIYSIKGEHRADTMTRYDLKELARSFDAIYGCRIVATEGEYVPTMASLRQAFSLISEEWVLEHWALTQ
ncbi:MAG: hypothetical protein GX633_07920 [Clostridiales bacterium]|nr:hypothetical protein [Clostridiales bacterium]